MRALCPSAFTAIWHPDMIVRFIVDYRGVLTDEEYYTAGTVADLPNGAALVRDGRAVAVEPDKGSGVPRRSRSKD